MWECACKNVSMLQTCQILRAVRESLRRREATISQWQDWPILDDSGRKNWAFKMHQICFECSRLWNSEGRARSSTTDSSASVRKTTPRNVIGKHLTESPQSDSHSITASWQPMATSINQIWAKTERLRFRLQELCRSLSGKRMKKGACDRLWCCHRLPYSTSTADKSWQTLRITKITQSL